MAAVKDVKDRIGKSLYAELKKEGLNAKEMLFIAEYITNKFNATQAYIKTMARKNSSYQSCGTEAHKLIKKPLIQNCIRKMFDYWLDEKKLKLERELCEIIYRRATYNVNTFTNPDGSFKLLDQIPEEWQCVIDGTEVRYFGKDAQRKVIITKLADRDKAIDKLDKYIQMTKDVKEINIHNMSKETEDRLGDIFAGMEYTIDDKEKDNKS